MWEKKKKWIYVVGICLLCILIFIYHNRGGKSSNGRILDFKLDARQIVLLPENTTFDSLKELEVTVQNQSKEIDNLMTEFEEVFISMDFRELCNELYASYYGSLGDEFIAIKETFLSFTCTQGEKENIPKYDSYQNNTEVLYDMGKILLEIEDSLNKQNFDDTYELFLDLYKEYSQYEKGVFVSEQD